MTLQPSNSIRPSLHFTPTAGWINDPNGLVYLDGEYHLFYQHHPHSLVWGPMHWGHAFSADLVRWQELPIALAPDELGMIFSGSAVVDEHDSAGFGPGALVAIFTHQGAQQMQSLAFSTDRGHSWTMYAGNPVLLPPEGLIDFRDPRVLWYGEGRRGHWVMALAVGQEIGFYTSPDLKVWTHSGSFGADHGAHEGVWECPELLHLPVDDGPERRWVLVVSVAEGAPAGGSGTQYFVGTFDGRVFTCDDPPGTTRWADYGADFYAPQAWQYAPGGRKIWIAWMNNWRYARETPATSWRGMMSVPRELRLASAGKSIQLVQRWPAELLAGWPDPLSWCDFRVDAEGLDIPGTKGATLLEITFSLADATATRVGVRVRVGASEATIVGYDVAQQALFVDRTAAGESAGPGFDTPQIAPISPRDGVLRLQILLDATSVEVLADDGRVAITSQIFPSPTSRGVEFFAEDGWAHLAELKVWRPLSR